MSQIYDLVDTTTAQKLADDNLDLEALKSLMSALVDKEFQSIKYTQTDQELLTFYRRYEGFKSLANRVIAELRVIRKIYGKLDKIN